MLTLVWILLPKLFDPFGLVMDGGGILADVAADASDDSNEVTGITDDSIKVVTQPQWAGGLQGFVDLPCGVPFP